MNEYKIIYYDDNFCLIALNTVYDVGSTIKKIIMSKIENTNFSGLLVFDLLLSSLSFEDENRFKYFDVNNGKVEFSNKNRNYCLSKEQEQKFNTYYLNNTCLLKNSLLLDFIDYP